MSQTIHEAQEIATAMAASLPQYPDTIILIPAFNEENNIGFVLDAIHREVPGIPVVVIDDGSGDKTATTAKAHGASVITMPYNSGYGVALQTGFIYALQHDYRLVIQMDGDRQHDPKYIKTLIQTIRKEEADVVIGSRFLGVGNYQSSFPRRLGINIFGRLASWITGQKVSDPTSGFQAIRGNAIKFMASDFYPPDYPDADLIIMLHRFGFKIREVPVLMHPNPDNKSMHRGHKTIYYVFKMFLSIFATILRKKPEL